MSQRFASRGASHGLLRVSAIPMNSGLAPKTARVGTALVGLAALAHASAIPILLVDDAYISFRYAWNLSHGNGLVFNLGEAVEGYSNLSWVLMTALLLRLGFPLEPGVRALALVFVLATPVLVFAWMLKLGARVALAFATACLLVATSSWFFAMLNGLEGALFAFLLLGTTFLTWRLVAAPSPATPILAGALGVALAATRPEGCVVYAAQWCAGAGLDIWRRQASSRRRQAVALGTFLAGFAALTAWRVVTYGSLVPNSVLAKIGSPSQLGWRLAGHFRGGLEYALEFAAQSPAVWLLGLLVIARIFRPGPRQRMPIQAALVLAAVPPVMGLVVALGNNGDWMPHHRLLAPYVPLCVLLCGVLALETPRIGVVALLVAGLSSVSPFQLARPSVAHLIDHQPSEFYATLCGLGSDLERAGLPQSTVVATELLGILSYCAPHVRIRDLNGLTDREIAHSEPSAGTFGRKTRPESLESMRPDMVIFNDLTYWRRLLAGSAWFSNELLSLSCGPLLAQNTYVFVRRDSVLAASGRLSVCPDERSTPAEAFKEAVCRRQDWPYSFTRDCATPFDSKNED